MADFIYPKGGWTRAYYYVQHRLHRLPDPPHRIARGIFAGVFTSFTPLFGLHFLIAAIMAKLMRGNIIAALLATFFGNPLTFPVIGTVSLNLGQWMLGTTYDHSENATLLTKFAAASREFKDNFFALFNEEDANWSHVAEFYSEVFLPYLVGGIVPGIASAMVCYYMSVPFISFYQKRRAARRIKRLEELRRKKAAKKADERGERR
ncbi:DUF2062 domain-containing protein [Aliiroseovarius sp. YM-037]|uniref:DUF2062 domain-containing protein n=1 Tax=Aliiroseovarius sp. YM-037 TaxID=3341728 RepID=UPI003A7FCD26